MQVELVVRQLTRRSEDCERNRQVVARAFLPQPGRGEVDGDAARRELELGRGDPAAHTLARLGARAVGQADDDERRQAGLDVGLDLDPPRLEPDKGMGDGACEHARHYVGKRDVFVRASSTKARDEHVLEVLAGPTAGAPVHVTAKARLESRPARSRISG